MSDAMALFGNVTLGSVYARNALADIPAATEFVLKALTVPITSLHPTRRTKLQEHVPASSSSSPPLGSGAIPKATTTSSATLEANNGLKFTKKAAS